MHRFVAGLLLSLFLVAPTHALEVRALTVPGATPGQMRDGELATNRADKTLFYKQVDGTTGRGSMLDAAPAGRKAVEQGDATDLSALAPDTSILTSLSEWLGLTPRQASSVAALRTISAGKIGDGMPLVLAGYYAPGDGGGGTFVWSRTSTATENPCTVIKPTAVSGAGRWVRNLENGSDLPLLACGVRADYNFAANTGTDNTTAIQAGINLAQSAQAHGLGLRLLVPPGGMLHSPLTISGQIEVNGPASQTAVFVLASNATAAAITIQTAGSNFVGLGYPQGNIVLRRFRITGQNGRTGNANAHGIRLLSGTFGAWVRGEDITVYNMPGSGIFSPGLNGFAHWTRGYFVGNGQYGTDTNSTVDWRYDECDWSLNVAGGARSSGDTQHYFANPNIYASPNYGLTAYYTDIKIVGGSIDSNGKGGILFTGDAAGGRRVILSGGLSLGTNGSANPGTYSDIEVSGAGTGLDLVAVKFAQKPRSQDATSNVLNNINVAAGSTASIVDMGSRYSGGDLYASGVTNNAGAITSPWGGVWKSYTPTMTGGTGLVAGATSGRYQIVGRRVDLTLTGTVTTAATSNNFFVALSLPPGVLPKSNAWITGGTNTSIGLSGQLVANQGAVFVRRAGDGGPITANGTTITVSGSFEIQ